MTPESFKNYARSRLPFSPSIEVVADGQYVWQTWKSLSTFVGMGLTHHSQASAGIGNSTVLDLKPYTTIDLRAGLEAANSKWRLSVWGRNVANEYYWNNVARGNDKFIKIYRHAGHLWNDCRTIISEFSMTIIRNLLVSHGRSAPGAKSWQFCLLVAFLLLCMTQHLEAADGENSYRSFDGTKIHYGVRRERTPGAVLVPGFTITGDSWKEGKAYDALLAAGFKVIFVDLRGNGLSDNPQRPEDYANDAEVRDLKILVGNLKLKSYSAVGCFRGAIIAAKLTQCRIHESRRRYWVEGMGLAFTNPNWQLPRQAYRALMGGSEPQLDWLIKRVKDVGLGPQDTGVHSIGPAGQCRRHRFRGKATRSRPFAAHRTTVVIVTTPVVDLRRNSPACFLTLCS